jgi:hypothetical protein
LAAVTIDLVVVEVDAGGDQHDEDRSHDPVDHRRVLAEPR